LKKYLVSNIASIINAKLFLQSDDVLVENILTDSRKLLFPANTLFFAIPGPRRSGSDFVSQLYVEGVRNFVLENKLSTEQISSFPEANFLYVENVLTALQLLAVYHRSLFNYPVVGITGSNGKTIIKEWLYQTLHTKYNIVRSPRSYNSQIGVPLSVWQMKPTNNLSIFEAGISQCNEMEVLQKIINPEIGILGYIGEAHAEGFQSFEEKIKEKLKLFLNSNVLIYCSDNKLVEHIIKTYLLQNNPSIKLLKWGYSSTANLHIKEVVKKNKNSFIYCNFDGRDFNLSIPFTDDASVYNAMICCLTMLYLEIDFSFIIESMKDLRPIAMRLELKQGNNQCKIINDSYSVDLDSLRIALDFLNQQDEHSKKTVILSDVLESGQSATSLYNNIASLLIQKKINRFIGIGQELINHKSLFNSIPQHHIFKSTDDFVSNFNSIEFNNEIILLKGARVFQFEKINLLLEYKIHDTVLEINLNALRSNLKTYRKKVQQRVKIMAMVKAFSYGSGSFEISNLLQQEGVDYLAVAYADEGVELRKAGIQLPIMVMNASELSFENIINYQLEPELFSFDIIHSFVDFLKQRQISNYPVHIKLDTGMHRLGFNEEDLDSLCKILTQHNILIIKSVFSHLVGSDDSQHDEYTKYQADLFSKMTDFIQEKINYQFLKHLSNTSAIHRHPNLQFDMVRLGIGLYGVDKNLKLENVTTLKTTISQIKNLKKGDTVGYNRKGILQKDSRIATVRIGYADGYPRILSNGVGKMLINQKWANVVGNICMDMTMLDVTDIKAEEGDEVIVFGEGLSVAELASWAGTIPYEILTNISQRVKRVYFEE
jgi:alanine racemase